MVTRTAFSNLRANVWVLHDPMFPLYVIRGERNFLVDCAILAKAGEIEKKLAALLGEEKIGVVLLTHSHYDHAGACSLLQKKHRFEIVASMRTKEILESAKAVAFIDDLNQKFKKILGDRSDTVFSKPGQLRGVRENDVIELGGGQRIEVLETPGHTRCSVSYLLQPENILFAGDAAGVIETSGKIRPLFLSSYSQYERSLEKLAAVGAETLALPHNSAVKGKKRVAEFLAASLAETRSLKEKILEQLGKSDDFPRIAENLLELECVSPTVTGPREAQLINATAMVKSVFNEFVRA
jgi:glyoxylase-like metal-dependent hydrolase (beta-lactamase superfamily II)